MKEQKDKKLKVPKYAFRIKMAGNIIVPSLSRMKGGGS